jgi:hypothetical protein
VTEARFCIITTAGTSRAGDAAIEMVQITLLPAPGHTVGSPRSASVTIVEDDEPRAALGRQVVGVGER